MQGREEKLTREEALELDKQYPSLRDQFIIPKLKTISKNSSNNATETECIDLSAEDGERECVYLCGNSLGLQPKQTKSLVLQELEVWSEMGVEGHFHHKYGRPWVTADDYSIDSMARIVGANPSETAIMNHLTVNLHLMMVPFYSPKPGRYKILMEGKAFPSDYFAIESQVKHHGYDPKDAIIEVYPKEGQNTIDNQDIINIIKEQGDSIALVLFSGVQYYTGQFFDIPAVTKAAHDKGCFVGWDLAHAVGNVPLQLHEWNVDFAVWCSYKYLNSGPGAVGGAFIHEKHAKNNRSRFAGWWGTDPSTKFEMDLNFKPCDGAKGYRLSNVDIMSIAGLKASLNVFDQIPLSTLFERSKRLTGYLESLLESKIADNHIQVLTPRDPKYRGSQLSLFFNDTENCKAAFNRLMENGFIFDYRKPNVIRIAPTALYNTFEDVWRFVEVLKDVLPQ
ncbi:pyridoxal phosphate-dependent transferase [Globomyces pollinis-pini]|nr:pyridoxal phosphate-dependent transferase [Globomyces pollinis-pini]